MSGGGWVNYELKNEALHSGSDIAQSVVTESGKFAVTKLSFVMADAQKGEAGASFLGSKRSVLYSIVQNAYARLETPLAMERVCLASLSIPGGQCAAPSAERRTG